MALLSKPILPYLRYNCYETAHTWTPSCRDAAIYVGRSAVVESFKMYAVMYIILQVISRKHSWEDTLDTLKSILASTCFLTFNVATIMVFICFYRRLFGAFYCFTPFLATFTSCILAILIERKSRRRTAALYVTNCASETFFNIIVSRGYVTPIPNGEVYLFAASISLYSYILRKYGFSKDVVSRFIKHLIGDEESSVMNDIKMGIKSKDSVENMVDLKDKKYSSEMFHPTSYFHRLTKLKHWTCPHKLGCVPFTVKGFLKHFITGFLAGTGIQCLSKARTWSINPKKAFLAFNYKTGLKLGMFLGGFCGTFKFINCLGRWIFDEDKPEFVLMAAFFGGLFMKFFPSSALAIGFMWKSTEVLCKIGIEKGIIPKIPGFTILQFAISGGFTLHSLVLEPHNMRPSYLKFLTSLTDNKLNYANRVLMDRLGFNSSKLFPNFFPDLDLRYVSRIYQETVIVWLIR